MEFASENYFYGGISASTILSKYLHSKHLLAKIRHHILQVVLGGGGEGVHMNHLDILFKCRCWVSPSCSEILGHKQVHILYVYLISDWWLQEPLFKEQIQVVLLDPNLYLHSET